ncbi:MAG: hypothetical protein UY49_C0037G0004 [Microgenomates group bacterium GW2011_GWC1_49_7]|nr:MAG: hypothetical protein UY49_C0037G0004 [Microgenomates group bacterium GW2011_GWC1_49_7]
MTKLERDDPFPLIEEEVAGKTGKELLALAEEYKNRALQLLDTGSGWRVRDKVENLYNHALTLCWEGRILRAREIFGDPNASEEELHDARHTAWNYKIIKLMEGNVPQSYFRRAKHVGLNGKIYPPNPLDYMFMSDFQSRAFINAMLKKHPDPDGKIWDYDEMDHADIMD